VLGVFHAQLPRELRKNGFDCSALLCSAAVLCVCVCVCVCVFEEKRQKYENLFVYFGAVLWCLACALLVLFLDYNLSFYEPRVL